MTCNGIIMGKMMIYIKSGHSKHMDCDSIFRQGETHRNTQFQCPVGAKAVKSIFVAQLAARMRGVGYPISRICQVSIYIGLGLSIIFALFLIEFALLLSKFLWIAWS